MLRSVYNYQTLFTLNPWTVLASYTNSGGSAVTIPLGTVFGSVFASTHTNGYLTVLPSVSTAVDGSQIPVGILTQTITVAPGATVTISLVNRCDKIAAQGVIFNNGTDTLYTAVLDNSAAIALGSYYTLMLSKGMQVTPIDENTFYDN